MHQSCDAYNAELVSSNNDAKFQELFSKNEVFFNYVGTNSGMLFSQLFVGFSLLKLMEVFDSLNVQVGTYSFFQQEQSDLKNIY